MTFEIQKAQIELLTKIESNQQKQLEILGSIRIWVVFFGVLTIMALIFTACNSILSY